MKGIDGERRRAVGVLAHSPPMLCPDPQASEMIRTVEWRQGGQPVRTCQRQWDLGLISEHVLCGEDQGFDGRPPSGLGFTPLTKRSG